MGVCACVHVFIQRRFLGLLCHLVFGCACHHFSLSFLFSCLVMWSPLSCSFCPLMSVHKFVPIFGDAECVRWEAAVRVPDRSWRACIHPHTAVFYSAHTPAHPQWDPSLEAPQPRAQAPSMADTRSICPMDGPAGRWMMSARARTETEAQTQAQTQTTKALITMTMTQPLPMASTNLWLKRMSRKKSMEPMRCKVTRATNGKVILPFRLLAG